MKLILPVNLLIYGAAQSNRRGLRKYRAEQETVSFTDPETHTDIHHEVIDLQEQVYQPNENIWISALNQSGLILI